jgi:SAM-dependent methyltransferase
LFARFDAALTDRGYLTMGGQIIDATVVPTPKQRNTEAEKAAIKEGRVPEAWRAKLRQKDRDARWSVKYSKAKVKEGADPKAFKPVDLAIPMFGYKNHIGIDRAHGLIRTWDASAANAHDGARLPDVVSSSNTGSGVLAAISAFHQECCPALAGRVGLQLPNGKSSCPAAPPEAGFREISMSSEGRPDVDVGGSDTSTPLIVAKRIGILGRWVDLRRSTILDAGCGAGGYVEALIGAGADARGIEYEANKVEQWQTRYPGDNRVCRGDLAGLDFPDESFDAVMLNEVLEHVPDDHKALAEARRVLRTDGKLVIFSPSRWHPIETHGVISRKSGKHLGGLQVPFFPYFPNKLAQKHYRIWARNYWPGELMQMVFDAGFDIVHHGYVWQTFENISGGKRRLVHRMAPLARLIAALAERVPIVRRLGVSQLVVAEKRVPFGTASTT